MDIAVIGMSGRFPEAKNIRAFYDNLRQGKDSVREFDRKRLVNTSLQFSRDFETFAYLEDIDLFDHEFFNISLKEAQQMDPHQRIILEVVYETFENAGYNPDFFHGTNTSVYVGDVKLEYEKLAEEFDPTLPIGNLNSITAGRISRYFNLRGASIMVDTACSSSLVAVHLACNELASGDVDHALVCGVNLKLFPAKKSNLFDVGINSPDGKTRSFSAEANGTGSGEAIASVLLKPLYKAIEDHDNIQAVIKGTAVNQDAALSGSLTAPSAIAQADVIKKAWKKSKIDPESITYIEAHGTGTKLGDPIEVQGIDMAFGEITSRKKFCALSSVKSNIGHTNTSAGISGMIKAILSLKHKELFPSIHFKNPNPFIDFDNSAVYVNAEFKKWEVDASPRRAGVSSFGISGTNCHVVLEEAKESEKKAHDGCVFFPIVVSAKNQESLKGNIAELSRFLKENPWLSLRDLSYTLTNGRKHFDYRFATFVKSAEDLVIALDNFSESEKSGPVDKTIIVFSDASFQPEDLDILASDYTVFEEAYEQCKTLIPSSSRNSNFYSFCFQYCLYKQLESKGLNSRTFLGEGTGELVVAALTEKITLAKALNQVVELVPGKVENLRERSIALLNKLEKQRILFAEIGGKGGLTTTLEELKVDHPNYEIVRTTRGEDVLQNFFKDLYLANGPINWALFYNEYAPSKIELPTYQFNKKRCWIREVEKLNVESTLYSLGWIQSKSRHVEEISGRTFLIFMDELGVGEGLVNRLTPHNTCIKIHNAESFERVDEHLFNVPFHDVEAISRLKNTFKSNTGGDIIYFAITQHEELPTNLGDNLGKGVFGLLHVVKAFHEAFDQENISLTVITSNAQKVLDEAQVIFPGSSTVQGMMGAIKEEYPLLKIKVVDVDLHAESKDVLINHLQVEAGMIDEKINVSWRKGERYIPKFEKIALSPNISPLGEVKEKKTYLISGGVSGIGLQVAKYFSKYGKAVNLVLISRRNLPGETEWKTIAGQKNHPHYEEIKTFQEILATGCSLKYFSADVTNVNQLGQVLNAARGQFGEINGVIHSAGVLKDLLIKEHQQDTFADGLSARLYGSINLHQMIYEKLDFFFMFTSYESLLGKEKYSSYGSASAFQDNYADQLRQNGIKAATIKWPEWDETGISFRNLSASNNYSISTEEGIEVFDYLFKSVSGINSNICISKTNPGLYDINPYLSTDKEEELFNGLAEMEPQLPVYIQKQEEGIKTSVFNPSFSEVENKIASIWNEVLKVKDLHLEDDFFDLGGHSLNGAQVINKVERDFGVKLDFDTLFDYSTLREFSNYVKGHFVEKEDIKPKDEVFLIEQQEYYEVTHIQKRIWLINQFDPQQSAYNMPSAYHLSNTLNVEAFEEALKVLVSRHESLRTSFIEVDGELKQKIWETEKFGFQLGYSDLSKNTFSEEDITQLINKEAIAPFDLKNGPLIKAMLFKLEDHSYIFFLSLHHIIADGWSQEVIIREVMSLYSASKVNGESLSPMKLQFKDYSAWVNAQLKGDQLKVHKEYWLGQFKTEPPLLALPLDFPRPARRTYTAKKIWLVLDAGISTSLRHLALTNNATSFMTLTSILKVLLYKYSGQTDITIGTPVSSRNHPDLENQIGIYLNTMVIRSQFSGTGSFEELLRKVKQKIIDAYNHQLYPFDLLIQDLGFQSERSRNLLFDVGFTFSTQNSLKSFDVEETEHPINATPINHNFNSVKADLWIHMNESDEEIKLGIDYNVELFRKQTVEKMIADFKNIALEVIDNPFNSLNTIVENVNRNQIQSNKMKQKEIKERNLTFLKNGL